MHGKYSPTLNLRKCPAVFTFNAKGEEAVTPSDSTEYDEETMFGDYDAEGFDSYGYSAYDKDGMFVGTGNGVDRLGCYAEDYIYFDEPDWTWDWE